jgi:hypothetical protein
MDRAIDSAAAEQGCVSRIHNRICREFRNIAANDLDPLNHSSRTESA